MATDTRGASSLSYAATNDIFMSREIYKQLADIQQDTDFMDFMMLGGMGQEVKAPVYSNGVNDALYAPIDTTGATITGSASSRTLTVVLTAPLSGVAIKGETYQLPNLQIARVMDKTTASGIDTLTLKNVENANLTLVAGGLLTIAGNAQEEGSYAPDPKRRNVTELKNQVQIFRATAERTDIATASQFEITIGGKNYLANMAMMDAYTRHKAEMSIALFKGKISDTLFRDTNPALAGERGYGIQTTRGLHEYIAYKGVVDNTALTNVYTAADELSHSALLEGNKAPLEYLVLGALKPMTTVANYYKGLGSSGITPAFLNVNGRTVDLQVDKVITSGGYTYNFKRLRMLSNTNIFPASSVYANSLYYLPMGKAKMVGGGTADYWGYNWMPVIEPGDGTYEMAEVRLGALAKRPTSGTAVESVTYETIAGFRSLAPSMFARQLVSS